MHVEWRDPRSIRFSQDSIKGTFKDGRRIQEVIDDLMAGRLSAADLPPIRIFEREGKLFTLDNRRLYAFQAAGLLVHTVQASAEDLAMESWKLTTRNEGTAIRIRGQ